jgi:ParB-like chromosome segregation protein Spo0J
MTEPLKFHPLADIFPPMEGAEFEELVADIKANGLREKIDLYQGKIADGRNRYRALLRLGIEPSADQKEYFRKALYTHSAGGEIAPHEQDNDARVRAYIISKNIHRRHLTADQRRDLIAKLVKAQPEKSDRQVAALVKASPTTVGTVRAKMEATGDVSKLDTRRDTKGREQPAKKNWSRERYKAHRTRKRSVAAVNEDAEVQDIVYGQACLFLERMTDTTRQKFFAYLTAKYQVAIVSPVKTPPKMRGRPPGSKNKSKTPLADEAAPPQRGGDNAPAPEVGAEIMKAKMAALDHGADPGPFPENLRRAPA